MGFRLNTQQIVFLGLATATFIGFQNMIPVQRLEPQPNLNCLANLTYLQAHSDACSHEYMDAFNASTHAESDVKLKPEQASLLALVNSQLESDSALNPSEVLQQLSDRAAVSAQQIQLVSKLAYQNALAREEWDLFVLANKYTQNGIPDDANANLTAFNADYQSAINCALTSLKYAQNLPQQIQGLRNLESVIGALQAVDDDGVSAVAKSKASLQLLCSSRE